MNSVGFPISRKCAEKRRALIPEDISLVRNRSNLYFEQGYGDVLGYSDEDYVRAGANICSREEVLRKDIVCDGKAGDAEYLGTLDHQTVFGWIHAVQNRDITDRLIAAGATVFAWEDMFRDGVHLFHENNALAGESAVYHAFLCYGDSAEGKEVAILGRGNCARGAMALLEKLGAHTTMFYRDGEQRFREELPKFDVIVNAIKWDTARKDHIIYREDLGRMKRGSMIIDISCDRNGGIESSVPTTIEQPTYTEGGVLHYVVDNAPSLFYKRASRVISSVVSRYVDLLIEGRPDKVLTDALIIKDGRIIDKRINEFQGR